MSDHTDMPEENGGMRAVVENIGNNTINSKPISEELRPYAEQVLNMDPFEDVAGASSATPGKIAAAPGIEALPPELQDQVHSRLQNVPPELRKEREGEAVLLVLKQRVYANRAETGIAENSLPYHKADVEIAGRIRQLDRQISLQEAELSDVIGHETVTDPVTGEKQAKPIMRLTGTRKRGAEAVLADLKRQRRLMVDDDGNLGVEAVRQKRAALEESAQLLKDRAEAAEDAAEVKRRIAAKLREERIEKQVTAHLRLARGGAGQ